MAVTSASSEKTMASGSGDGRSSRSESFIREYHVYYQRIWNLELGEVAVVTEVAVAVLEDNNTHDRYAVTKVRDLRISSLLPCFFLDRAIFDFLIMHHIAQFF